MKIIDAKINNAAETGGNKTEKTSKKFPQKKEKTC